MFLYLQILLSSELQFYLVLLPIALSSNNLERSNEKLLSFLHSCWLSENPLCVRSLLHRLQVHVNIYFLHSFLQLEDPFMCKYFASQAPSFYVDMLLFVFIVAHEPQGFVTYQDNVAVLWNIKEAEANQSIKEFMLCTKIKGKFPRAFQ